MAYFTFPNTVTVPYESLLKNLLGGHDHKGGPIWPDWENQRAVRFNRGQGPADTLPGNEAPTTTLSGDDWAWAGPITAHFGHGISDYATRIAGSLAEIENARLVFSSEKTALIGSLEAAPKWFRQMLLEWFSIPEDRIHFVTEPTLFETLNVVPQAERGPDIGPSGRYLDLLDAITDRHFGKIEKRGTVYVSRAGISGKFAGEIAFEAAMHAAGVTVFRPETVPLVEQLRVFATAERLIFAEGSALHGAQLMGRALGDVVVINRRRGFKLAEAFTRPRARSLEYLDHVGGLVYGLTEGGKSAAAIGIAFMDMPKLLDAMDARGIPIKAHWDQSAYEVEIWNDLMLWLRGTSRRPSSRMSESRDLIYHTLRGSGFSSWIPRAKEMLGEDRTDVLAQVTTSSEAKMARVDSVNALLAVLPSDASYLEIGVQTGETFLAANATRKVAVDPKFLFDSQKAAAERPLCSFYEIPSDAYFGDAGLVEKFDLIFLDGLHTFEQTLRDFTNAIERLKDGGIILIDDVMPNSFHASLRDYSKTAKVRQALGLADRAWMGDVYRLVYFIEAFFQQFSYATIDGPQPQTVVWRQTRSVMPERLVCAIGSLSYDAMVLSRQSFNFMNLDDITTRLKAR